MGKVTTGDPLPGRQSIWIAEKGPDLKMVDPHAAAIDIGSSMHMAAANPGATDTAVQAFGTRARDLHDPADWFRSCGVTSVATDSSGVFWIPAFEILEQHGCKVILVNAPLSLNAVHSIAGQWPYQKCAGSEDQCQRCWLRHLHSYGLLRGSFRPETQIATLRAYMRQRERPSLGVCRQTAAHICYLAGHRDAMAREGNMCPKH